MTSKKNFTGAHPLAEQSQQSADALQTKLKQIKSDATEYAEALDAARVREAKLASALKAFHEKRSRVMEWGDSSHTLVALNENGNPIGLERGCGLSTVDNKVDAYQAEYQHEQPGMVTLVNEMQILSNELTEGQHVDAEAVAEQQTARKADIDELSISAEKYEEQLNGILRRETDLVATQKQFKAGASKLENWLSNSLALTAIPEDSETATAFGPGNNVEAIEILADTFAEQHTNKVDQYQSLLNEMTEKAAVLGDGGHEYGPTASSQIEELRTQLAEAGNNATTYSQALEESLARENDLLASLKKFNSHERRIGAWSDTCSGMVTVHDCGLGVNLREIQNKLDQFQNRYTAKVETNNEAINGPMQDLSYLLLTGEHASAPICQEKLETLTGKVTTLESDAATYFKDLQDALVREQELESNLKAFRAGLQQVESWVKNCDERVIW